MKQYEIRFKSGQLVTLLAEEVVLFDESKRKTKIKRSETTYINSREVVYVKEKRLMP
jgi:hypothetical protein